MVTINNLNNDNLFDILVQTPLKEVPRFCQVSKQMAELCRTERAKQEIKRKEDEYYEILIDNIVNRTGSRFPQFFLRFVDNKDMMIYFEPYRTILLNKFIQLMIEHPELMEQIINHVKTEYGNLYLGDVALINSYNPQIDYVLKMVIKHDNLDNTDKTYLDPYVLEEFMYSASEELTIYYIEEATREFLRNFKQLISIF